MSVAPGASLELDVVPTPLAIIRLPSTAAIPGWTTGAVSLLSVTRTPAELSIVIDVAALPVALHTGVAHVALRVRGPLPLDLVGVFAALATPLAAAHIPIFPIATFDTDYLLVRERDVEDAIVALSAAGHRVFRP